MTGCHNGVGAQLSQTQPYLIAILSVAHRLSLAAVQDADGIALLEKYERTFNAIYKYFSTSGSEQNRLENMQQIFDSPVLEYKQIFDVRWLSFGYAVEAVLRMLPALIALENDAKALGEPTASGLANFVSTYYFVALTYFLAGILSLVNSLSKVIQKNEINLFTLTSEVEGAICNLKMMMTNPGPKFHSFLNEGIEGIFPRRSVTVTEQTDKCTVQWAHRRFCCRKQVLF